MQKPPPSLRAVRKELAERKLAQFIRLAWPVIEPGQPYVHGWHIDAVCEHLEAITYGHISRLLINVPPGTMKSLAAGVFWPAWEWGPKNRPSTRYVAASHSQKLAIRDNLRTRRLVASDWYQELWGDRVALTKDQNVKEKFENEATGIREAVAAGSITGARGDRVIIDDPLSVEDAGSEKVRDGVNEWFLEAVPTRLNNPDRSAIVVIMQRLHERDVSGIILAKELGYEHLMLPMEFEPERRCVTSIGFKDIRTDDGELLFPARFPRHVVDRDKKVMGSYAVAGQFQQRPAPREGGMFKKGWFEVVGAAPANTRWVRHWDLAASAAKQGSNPAYTAGVKLGRAPDGTFYVGHVARVQAEGPDVRRLIKNTAGQDGEEVEVSLPQDPGQAGKVQARDLVAMLAGFRAHAEPETGDKVTRAEPFAAQAEAGNVKLIRGDWNDAYLEELSVFPAGAHKDQVDASSGAFGRLMSKRPYGMLNVV
ncbi:phage terminase large subunit [Alsobacter sp. KACC 23698]|uniref:Phage terminase large subunit n=1 Tax=Alsobacter sp. KACC 23698 TaxID=3149229 RepID=A0AAU7J8T5_9HYPH